MPQLRLALAQINPTVGDLDGNADLIVDAVARGRRGRRAPRRVPEMVLTGYPIEDLAFRPSFVDASRAAMAELAERLAEARARRPRRRRRLPRPGRDPPLERLGSPKGSPQNAVAVLYDGQVVARQAKHHLWNYGVGDEIRNFVPGDTINVIQVRGVDVAIAICEDLWQDGPSAAARRCRGRAARRPERLAVRAQQGRRAARAVRATRPRGRLRARLRQPGRRPGRAGLRRRLARRRRVRRAAWPGRRSSCPSCSSSTSTCRPRPTAMPDPDTRVLRALRTPHGPLRRSRSPSYDAVRSPGRAARSRTSAEIYARARRSACATTCARTASARCCWGCPAASTRRSSAPSRATRWARRTSSASPTRASGRPSTPRPTRPSSPGAPACNLDTVPIAPMVDAFRAAVKVDGLAEENLQARIRAVVWMALSNQHGHLVLACGNKSELAVGYSTIYGDAVGGFAPIKDVPKTLVWELATWRNADAERARRAAADPGERDQPSRRRPSCVPASSTPTRCPPTTCSTTSSTTTSSATAARPTWSRRASTPRWSSGSSRWSTGPSTSAGSTRRARRSRARNFGRDRRAADHQRLARTPLTGVVFASVPSQVARYRGKSR